MLDHSDLHDNPHGNHRYHTCDTQMDHRDDIHRIHKAVQQQPCCGELVRGYHGGSHGGHHVLRSCGEQEHEHRDEEWHDHRDQCSVQRNCGELVRECHDENHGGHHAQRNCDALEHGYHDEELHGHRDQCSVQRNCGALDRGGYHDEHHVLGSYGNHGDQYELPNGLHGHHDELGSGSDAYRGVLRSHSCGGLEHEHRVHHGGR